MKYSPMKYVVPTGAAALACTMFALAQTPPPDKPRDPSQPPPRQAPQGGVKTGHMQTPPYAQPLDTTLTENTIQFCKDADFKGEQTTVADAAKAHRAGTLNALPGDYDNDVSSIRFNIAPGTLVVLFDDASGKGMQLALWGKGRIADLGAVDFENAATRWAWYNVGGGAEPRSAGGMELPHGGQPLATNLAADTLQLFEDQQFAGAEEQKISPVTSQPSGAWNMLPGKKENGLSSLRWNLPEGVIVMFSAEDNGNNNIIIFGEGQNPDLGVCGFDNRASRWTWAHIGAAKPDKPDTGTPRQPPPKPDTPPATPPASPPRKP